METFRTFINSIYIKKKLIFELYSKYKKKTNKERKKENDTKNKSVNI